MDRPMFDDLFADHRPCHDDTQMSCILSGRTEWGRYKQAVRELYKRVRGLRMLETERELLLIDIDEMSIPVDNEFDERRRVIKLRRKHSEMEEIDRTISETKREADRFYAEARHIKDRIGEVSEERRRNLDREAWEHEWLSQAATGLLAGGRIPDNTIKHIASLPVDSRNRLVEKIHNGNELAGWFWDNNTAQTPQLDHKE